MQKFLSIKEAMKHGGGSVAVRGEVYQERGSSKNNAQEIALGSAD